MPSRDSFIRWHLLGAGGLPSRNPVQLTGWMIDIGISSPYVATGQHHKVRKMTNSGTRLCSYVPETKNVVIFEQYMLKTSNRQEGILIVLSKFSPAGIIRAGKEPTLTILLEAILVDPPEDFVEVLPGFKLVDQGACAKRIWGLHQSSGATSGALYLRRGQTRSGLLLSGYQQTPCWSGQAQKAEVHARRPHLRPKPGGPWPFELVRQRW